MATQAQHKLDDDLAWAVEDVRARLDRYALHRDYYDGRHRLVFATEKYRNTFGDLFREFADNMCDDVVDESVDRLGVQAWEGKNDAQTNAAMEAWETLKGEARLGILARDSWGLGDGFLMVWPASDGKARWHVQRPEQCAVRYDDDDPDRLAFFAKVWREGKLYRANLYYSDGTLARFATKGTSAGGGLPQARAFLPFVGTDAAGEPQEAVTVHDMAAVPAWHFPADELGRYGRSVLADVIPLQDALNKSVSDLLVAMERRAMPSRWATGVEVQIDPVTGKETDPFDERKPFWWTAGKEAAFAQFPQDSMADFLAVQDSLRLEIARKGALPVYSVPTSNGSSTSTPSGIALLVQEGRQVKRVKDWGRDHGTSLCQIMAHTLTLNGIPTEPEDLTITWVEASTRDEKALLEGLQIKVNDLGVTKAKAQAEMGYTPEEIGEMADERAANAPDAGPLPAGGRANPLTASDAEKVNAALGLPGGPGEGSPLAGE